MPIEIVCKIKFAEEDAKPKEKEAGDEQSLLGAAQGTAAPRDLATFASTSTLHGLGRACGPGPHGLRRTLWALALLTSLAAFLYQAAGLARGYLTRPHLVAMDPAAPAPVAGFPAVTLCNINRFRHSALSDADIFHLANLTGLPPKDRDGHRAAGLRYPEPDMVDILNRTGHQLADMLKSCNFSGHHCSASNFSVVYTRYGKCYTFNADPQSSLPSRAGGMGSGLEIMLDIQQEEYLPIWRETNETSFEAGIRVQIHSQEEPPYIHQLGFGVSPGFQTFVSCQEQRLTYLPQPWGNCRAESRLREPELQGYSAYSVSACRLRCEKEAVLQRCHCRMVHMPGNETICPPNIYIECADHTLGLTWAASHSFFHPSIHSFFCRRCSLGWCWRSARHGQRAENTGGGGKSGRGSGKPAAAQGKARTPSDVRSAVDDWMAGVRAEAGQAVRRALHSSRWRGHAEGETGWAVEPH
ncbi:acid-sensing ion channel 4 isoform X2 [Ursus americanus]|uniref:acid-sensing ion channel 4 isoform X2 n=1 Tax=Ursus americanus TaxID=9643 RepID=UPI001E67A0B7|nr:acid-sensing ion channel 4 isoform X2 [Ursus americanus]